MSERVKSLIKPMIYIAASVFVICWIIHPPESLDDYCSYIGYSISSVSILFVLYDRLLWRYIPWNRPPLLKEKYVGKIAYRFNGEYGEKPMEVTVEQSWLSIKITTKTDVNASNTVTGTIVSEHGKDVLYYTYVTEPDALCQDQNPIQYGTCRMTLNGTNDSIRGKYWTSSKTVGDIVWDCQVEES